MSLESMTDISFGDRVRHPNFPEWGNGSVVKVEGTALNGEPTKRISVRFSSAGLKTFAGNSLPLELLSDGHVMPGDRESVRPAIAEVEYLEKSGLTSAVEQKLLDIMLAIPMGCRDPFNAAEHRLKRTLDLYKYDMSGRGLMEWAMAQTGMDDPLTRFNRTELEEYFTQFALNRDQHLAKLLREMQTEQSLVTELVAAAPAGAKHAVAKLS